MGNPLDDGAKRKLTAFKQQISYESIIARLGPEKRYVVDWVALLSKFSDAEGEKWSIADEPSYYVSGLQGNANIDISSGDDAISMELYSVEGSQRTAIDMALGVASYGTTMQIVMEVMPANCPGDFCLIYSDGDEITSLYMVKGNILVMLESSKSRSVLPVGRYIADAMEKTKMDRRLWPLNKVHLELRSDRRNVKQGETFTFTVGPKSILDSDDWLIEVAPAKDGELECLARQPGTYTYKALKKGSLSLATRVMHKRTLQVKEEIFVVNVN